MKARLLIGSVATVATLALACKDETPVYAGQPTPGAAATMTLNKTAFSLPAGGKATLAAHLFDSAGNVAAGAVTFASCNSAVVSTTDSSTAPANWTAATTVTAVAPSAADASTLIPTPTCLTATSGAIVDTALVVVGPATVAIAGPTTVVSGRIFSSADTQVYKVTGFSPSGAALTTRFFHQWGTSDTAMFTPMSRTADSVRIFSPGHIGVARVLVTAVGGATAVLNVNIVPDSFFVGQAGVNGVTIPAANATTKPAVDTFNLTRCANTTAPCVHVNPTFGAIGTGRVIVDGVETFTKTAISATVNSIVMPPITHASSTVPLLVGNMGGGRVFQNTTLVSGVNATATTDANDPLNDVAATAPLTARATAGTSTSFAILSGASCVDATVAGAAGTDCLDWYSFTNTSADPLTVKHSVTITLKWFTDADLDVIVYDNTGTGTPLSTFGSTRAPGGFTSVGEVIAQDGKGNVIVLPQGTAGANMRVLVRIHSAGAAPATLYRIQFTMT